MVTEPKELTFEDCLKECFKHPDLIKEWERLSGKRLFLEPRKPIEIMIDQATGYDKFLDAERHEAFQEFITFCFECVWLPFLAQAIREAMKDNLV